MNTGKLLEVRNLQKFYNKDGVPTKALNGITFDVFPGEYLGIMGASGSGKTTLLNCIATIIKPTSGQIMLSGENISAFSGSDLAEYRGTKIGYLFQDFALLDNLTGKENILLPLSIHNVAASTAEKKLFDLADFLGIRDVLEKFPSQMSGGQKQRVAAARCLISNPSIVLADEPTGALDTKSARQLMEKLQKINQKQQRTILMVTHDPNAASFCTRILFIQDGVIFHEIRKQIQTETQEAFYERILQVMAQMGEEVRMFFNIAWRNAKRNRSENLIYFLTMITAVAAFYIMLSLEKQDVIRFLAEIESDAVNRLLTTMMPAVYLCALLFVFFLVTFANKYQLECRSKELGLYLLFGMKRKRLFLQLLMEGLFTSILALCGGIVGGGFLSEIISLATSRLVGQDIISHQSSFSVSAVVWTVLGFMLVQAIALFILGGRLCRQEIHQLLYGEIAKKQKVGKTGGSIVTLILGTVLLLFAYWLVLNHFMAAGRAMLFLAVLLGIMGTILFIRGLARLLSLLAGSNKKKSTQGLYTFTLRQLQENIVNKFVSISVASLLMMLTIMLIADGSVRIMSSSDQLTRGASVYDFTISGEDQTVEQYLTSEKMAPYVSHVNRMETGVMKRPDGGLSSYMDWSLLRREIVHALPSNVEDPATQGAVSYEIDADNPASLNLLALIDTSGSAPYLLRASSYNQLLEASGEDTLTLNDNEAILYLNPDFFGSAQAEAEKLLNQIIGASQEKHLIYVDGQEFTLVPSVPMKGLTADRNIRIFTALIVSDNVFESYINPDSITVSWNFCIPKDRVEADGLMASIMEVNDILRPSGLVFESYLNNFGRQLFYIVSSSYTTLYMGFMLLIIACALLALQFLTQMQATKARYLTLSLLGARREQMKKSMHRQVLYYFLLPLGLACISGTVGLYVMQKYLSPSVASDAPFYLMASIMAGIVILILAVYAIAVARTADREIAKLNWKPNS